MPWRKRALKNLKKPESNFGLRLVFFVADIQPERWGLRRRNPKWFDRPFDGLTVLSKVEGQTQNPKLK